MDSYDRRKFESAFHQACDECLGVFVENDFKCRHVYASDSLVSQYECHGKRVAFYFLLDLRDLDVSCNIGAPETIDKGEESMRVPLFWYLVKYRSYRGGVALRNCQIVKEGRPKEWARCKIKNERDLILRECMDMISGHKQFSLGGVE